MSAIIIIQQGMSYYVEDPSQWQPTPTNHDPNPPITLLDPAVVTTPTFFFAS